MLWLWHSTLQVVYCGRRSSGAACPFVIERQSKTSARLQEASPRTPDLSGMEPWRASESKTLALHLHVAHRRRGFGTALSWQSTAAAEPAVLLALSNLAPEHAFNRHLHARPT
jgi:hypothetical protein